MERLVAAVIVRAQPRRGEMPHMRLGRGKGRGYWIRRDAFEQWLRDYEQQGAQE